METFLIVAGIIGLVIVVMYNSLISKKNNRNYNLVTDH